MNEVQFFFVGWWPLLRILVVGTLLFVTVVVLLRITGNRALSGLTTFDFIVAVAVGAVFGRAMTARDLSLSEAVTSIVLLVLLQYLLSLLRKRSRFFSRLIVSDPVVLYAGGALRHEALHRENLLEEDVLGAVRGQGYASLDEIERVVLEPTGTMSVIPRRQARESRLQS